MSVLHHRLPGSVIVPTHRRPPPGTGLVIGLAFSALFYVSVAAVVLLF